jgi:hypothetical protein
MKSLIAALSLIILLPVLAFAEDGVAERFGLDPVLQGVWVLHGLSGPGGVNAEQMSPPTPFATASASRIRLADGITLHVERVLVVDDVDGAPGNIVLFTNGAVWIFSKPPGQMHVLVQAFSSATAKEKARMLITVR